MILFPTFNHVLLLFLFIYLGLSSGIIFNIIDKFSTFIKVKVDKSSSAYNKKKKKVDALVICIPHEEQKNDKKQKNKNQNKQIKNYFIKFKQILNKIKIIFIKIFASILLIITLTSFVLISFLINLEYNFGEIRLVYVTVWVLSFFVGKSFFNLLANHITNFYNYLCKRKSKYGSTGQQQK